MYVFAVHLQCAFFSILKCHGRNGVGLQNLAKGSFTRPILRCIFALRFQNQFKPLSKKLNQFNAFLKGQGKPISFKNAMQNCSVKSDV
jgi:hypothetical protein